MEESNGTDWRNSLPAEAIAHMDSLEWDYKRLQAESEEGQEKLKIAEERYRQVEADLFSVKRDLEEKSMSATGMDDYVNSLKLQLEDEKRLRLRDTKELDEAHQEIQHMLEEKQHLAKELKLAKDALAQAERNQTSNSNVREPVNGGAESGHLHAKVAALEAELQERKDVYQEDLDDVERRLVEALRELESANQTNAMLQQNILRMEQGAQTADTPNENEELAKLRQAVTELTAERDTLQARVAASQEVISRAAVNNKQLDDACEELTSKVASLEKDRAQLSQQLQDLEFELEDLKSTTTAAVDAQLLETSRIENLLAEARSELEAPRTEQESASADQNKTLSESVSQLQASVQALTAELHDRQEQLESKISEVERLRGPAALANSLAQSVEKLTSDLAAAQQELSATAIVCSLQELEQTRANVTKADALQEALEFAQMELARTNDELSAALMRGQELQALATDTESIKVAHDAVQAELQHTKATLEETLVALAGAQAAHDATQTTLSDTLRQVEGLKQDILAREEETLQAVAEETRIRTGFENAVETAAAELSVALERGSSLQKDLQEAAQQLESLQQAYNERDAACSAAMQAKETAQQELQELRAQIESFKEAEIYHCNLQRRLDEVQQELEDLQSSYKEREASRLAAEQALITAQERIAEVQAQLEAAKSELESLEIAKAEVDEKAEARPCEGCRELSIAYTQASEDLLLAQRQARDAATQAEMLASDNASLEAKMQENAAHADATVHEERIAHLESDLADATAALESVKFELNIFAEEKLAAQARTEELESELKALQHSSATIAANVAPNTSMPEDTPVAEADNNNELMELNRELRQQLEDKEKLIAHLQQESSVELSLREAHIQQLQGEYNQARARLVELQQQLETNEASLMEQQERLQEIQALIDQYADSSATSAEDIAQLRTEHEALMTKNADLMSKMQEVDTCNAELEARVFLLDSQLAEGQESAGQTGKTISLLESRIEEMTNALRAAETRLSEREQRVQDLEAVIQEAEALAAELDQKAASADSERGRLERELSALQELLDAQDNADQVHALQDTIQALEQQRLQEYEKNAQEMAESTQQIESLKSEISQLEGELREVQISQSEALESMQVKVAQDTAKMEQLRLELDEKERELSQVRDAHAVAQESLSVAEVELGKLRESLAEATEELRTYRQAQDADMGERDREIEELRGKLAETMSVCEERSMAAMKLAEDLRLAQQCLEQYKLDVSSLQDDLRAASGKEEAHAQAMAELDQEATLARDRVTDLEEQVRRLESTVTSLQAEVAHKEEDAILCREMAGAEADNLRLELEQERARSADYAAQMETISAALAKAEAQLPMVQTDLTELKATLDEERQQNHPEQLRDAQQALQDSLEVAAHHEAKISELQAAHAAETESLRSKCLRLETDVASLKDILENESMEVETLQKALDQEMKKSTDYEAELEERDERITNLVSDLDGARVAQDEMRREAQRISGELAKVQDGWDAKADEYNARISTLQERITLLENEAAERLTDLALAKESLTLATAKAEKLESEVVELTQKMSAVQAEHAQMASDIAALRAAEAELQQAVQTAKDRGTSTAEKARLELEAAEAALARIESAAAAKEAELQKTIDSMQEGHAQSQPSEELEQLKENLEAQEMKYLSLITKMRKLERSNATLKAKLKDHKHKEVGSTAAQSQSNEDGESASGQKRAPSTPAAANGSKRSKLSSSQQSAPDMENHAGTTPGDSKGTKKAGEDSVGRRLRNRTPLGTVASQH